jgi:hypothetical protein
MMMNGTGFETRAKIDGGGGVIYRSFAGKGGINGTEKGEVYSHISYRERFAEWRMCFHFSSVIKIKMR